MGFEYKRVSALLSVASHTSRDDVRTADEPAHRQRQVGKMGDETMPRVDYGLRCPAGPSAVAIAGLQNRVAAQWLQKLPKPSL